MCVFMKRQQNVDKYIRRPWGQWSAISSPRVTPKQKQVYDRSMTGIFGRVLRWLAGLLETPWGLLPTNGVVCWPPCNRTQTQVFLIVSACMCLHNIMRTPYTGLQNVDNDREGNDRNVIPGAWRGDSLLQDVHGYQIGNVATREGRHTRVYLKHYYNQVSSVSWQRNMIFIYAFKCVFHITRFHSLLLWMVLIVLSSAWIILCLHQYRVMYTALYK